MRILPLEQVVVDRHSVLTGHRRVVLPVSPDAILFLSLLLDVVKQDGRLGRAAPTLVRLLILDHHVRAHLARAVGPCRRRRYIDHFHRVLRLRVLNLLRRVGLGHLPVRACLL